MKTYEDNNYHKMTRLVGMASVLFLVMLLLVGCPKTPPKAIVTFSFPDGKTCESNNIMTNAAAVVSGVGGPNPVLTITICAMCVVDPNPVPLVGAVINGSLEDVSVPGGYRTLFKGATLEKGCYVKKIPLQQTPDPKTLIGQQFEMTIVDISVPPQVISTQMITIK